jgi:SAM-dependent MidA family methyltransferase
MIPKSVSGPVPTALRSDLPVPAPDALAHSQRLAALIAGEIARAGGWIGFARYMELALYAPGLGYYAAGSTKLGGAGDFVTAPELSVLFSHTLARQAAEILAQAGGDVLELGPGSGRMAADLLPALAELRQLPGHYLMLEVSGDLRERQSRAVDALPQALRDRVRWIGRLPDRFDGLVLANEVLDALPVELVGWKAGELLQRGVAVRAGRFEYQDRPLAPGRLRDEAQRLARAHRGIGEADEYVSEIGLAARDLVGTLARMLARGALVFVDYGFGEAELYHPQRSRGTLMCHYRHRAHDDPFLWPGLQDITAHVDFSGVARAGADAGVDLLGYTSQANFLVNLGITELLTQLPSGDAAAFARAVAPVQKLLSPAEMGELFKVLALGRGLDAPLTGFARGSLLRLL